MPADTGSGSSTRNVEPLPSPSLQTEMVPPCSFHDLFGDGETEPEPAMRARGAHLRLAEAVEYVRQEFALDADAGIGHFDGHHGAVATRAPR